MRLERDVIFWTTVLVIFVGLLWLFSPVLLPFVVGMAIAYMLDPLTTRLTRRGLSRLVAALLILAAFVVVAIGLSLLVVPVLIKQFYGFVSEFIGNLPNYVQHIQDWVDDPNHPMLKRILGDAFTRTDRSVSDLMLPAIGYLNGVLSSLLARGPALLSLFSLVIVAPVVAFYLIVDWNRVLDSIDSLVPLPER